MQCWHSQNRPWRIPLPFYGLTAEPDCLPRIRSSDQNGKRQDFFLHLVHLHIDQWILALELARWAGLRMPGPSCDGIPSASHAADVWWESAEGMNGWKTGPRAMQSIPLKSMPAYSQQSDRLCDPRRCQRTSVQPTMDSLGMGTSGLMSSLRVIAMSAKFTGLRCRAGMREVNKGTAARAKANIREANRTDLM